MGSLAATIGSFCPQPLPNPSNRAGVASIPCDDRFLRRTFMSRVRKSVTFEHRQRIHCSSAVRSLRAEEKMEVFDANKAALLVKELRGHFNSGKTKSYEWRVAQLKAISKMVDEREKEILEALQIDLSKPETEAFVSEILLIKSSCQFAVEGLKQWMKPEKVKTSILTFPSSAEIVSEPLGVVLIISTWNYPFLLSLDPVIGAIAAGNAVVLKPSEIAPASSKLLADLLPQYLDKTVIRVVEGAIPETTTLLEQKWDKILYTGNGRVGRIVMAAAAKHLTPVLLELGGKNPAVVDPNVDLQVAVRRILAGKWACNNGQACIGVDHIITTKDFAPKLIDALRVQLGRSFGEDPMKSKDISRIINLNHFTRLKRLLDEEGISSKIVLGGQTDEKQLKIAPTLLLDVPDDSLLMTEEIFGPLLPIVTVDAVEDSFDLILSKPKPLAAYLFTKDEKLKKKFVDTISAGAVTINDTVLHVTVSELPFGGVGESGMGAYHGKFSFDAFSHKKAVFYRGFFADATLRYPPYSPRNLSILKALTVLTSIGFGRSK
ncbi:Aldehyde dehydrogenase 3 member I1, chloroplastic [Dionaea muscipula]